MQNTACPEQSATKRVAKSPKIKVPLLERAAITPNELAGLFGKQTTWGYRLIYAGKVKVLKDLGRTLVPIAEVHRLLSTAEVI